MTDVLPDLLVPGLRVVFCGTAAGTASALKGAYYAGPGNRFWRTLHETGLTPRRLEPQEFRSLPGFGIGLTDLAKAVSGADADLPPGSFDIAGFIGRIVAAKPGLVAFNGVAAARAFLGIKKGPVANGIRPAGTVPGMPSFAVLPSTSGAASGSWDVGPWQEVANYAVAAGRGDS